MLRLFQAFAVSICTFFSFNIYAAELVAEKTDDFISPNLEDMANAPIHLYQDDQERTYAIQARGKGTDWVLSKYFLTEEDELYLANLGARIKFLPDVNLTGEREVKKGGCVAAEYPPNSRV